MTEAFDPRKSYRAVKAHEGMLAFVSFNVMLSGALSKEGLLKIAASARPFRGDRLTLTFIIDLAGQKEVKPHMIACFERLRKESLAPHLASELEQVGKVPLDLLEKIKGWYIEEVNIDLRTYTDQKKTLIEQILLPALEEVLGFDFQPVEWWPMERARSGALPDWAEQQSRDGKFKRLLKGWLGLD